MSVSEASAKESRSDKAIDSHLSEFDILISVASDY